jgi:hypothetical protein
MSLINRWSEGKCKVVPIVDGDTTVYARVRAATQGEMQAQALLPGKGKAKPGASVDPEVATAMHERLLHCCVLAIGESEAEMEPCTILRTERDPVRPGTRGLSLYALPSPVANQLSGVVLDLTIGGGWRESIATFPGSAAGDDGRDGGAVRVPTNGPA